MSTFTSTKIVLMYKTEPTESYYDKNFMFVDLDQQSGGYPTRATPENAHNFRTVEKAKLYDSKNEFDVVELQAMFSTFRL